MSRISQALTRANAIISTAKGESLYYRANSDRAWAPLVGFVLDRDDVQPPVYDDIESAESTIQTGRLSGPVTPALAVGYEIKDGSDNVWALIVPPDFDQQQLCPVRRTTVDNAGPNRGGAL